MVKSHELQHPRKVSSIESGETENWVSSDGGTTWYAQKSDSSGRAIVVSGLVPHEYDYIALSYTGDNLTGVVYKTGGVGGTTVATLVLAYTGSVLDSITKS